MTRKDYVISRRNNYLPYFSESSAKSAPLKETPRIFSDIRSPRYLVSPVRQIIAVVALAYLRSILTKTSTASMTGNSERRNIVIIGSPPSNDIAIK